MVKNRGIKELYLPLPESNIILDLCGGTGSWSKPWADAGYDVRIIDINFGHDVRLFKSLNKNVYGVLAAPPCDRLTVSAAYLWTEENLLHSLSIADACMRIISIHNPHFWALENPVGRLRDYYGEPRLIFQPCDYGDPYTKKTLLWGDFNIPEKKPVEPTEGSKLWKLPPSEDRKKIRATTPSGFAKAFFEANKLGVIRHCG